MSNLKKFIQLTYNRFRYPELVERQKNEFDKSRFLVLFQQLSHPLRTYGEIKYEGRGSLFIANVLAILYFFTQVFVYFRTGYLFSDNEPSDFSLSSTLISSVGILILWTVCNWVTGTLVEGEGSFKELWIAACYSVLPYIIIQIIASAISPVLILSELTMLNTFKALSQIWMLLLIFCGMMIIQQFTVSKALVSSLITVLMMLAVTFLILLFFSIFQQMFGFATTFIRELGR